ncbi:MAG: aminotransferase class I/II-fold pyridoxal phosphate-dependent enzyme [Acidobacteria bacterium]|nr:aminotransferase class I/II-fold pyridoxal phosphate-dependent enzyme [Acidobacteriota bacterium]
MNKKRDLETRIVHGSSSHARNLGAVVPPIFTSSTFELSGDKAYEEIRYGRMSNSPTHDLLHDVLAAAESGETALVTSSGMAAITSTILGLLKPGDHAIFQNTLYGGTWDFVTRDLPELGISVERFNGNEAEMITDLIRPETKLIYSETATNPLLEVTDHEAVVRIARERGITTAIDNTFASPVNFRPLELGYDISLHSATKYLNGHTDLIAGAIITSRALMVPIRHKLVLLGGSLNGFDCHMMHRGLKTLALRIRKQNENALALAKALQSDDRVTVVNYPGLGSHPQHERAAALFDGFGGMLSFDVKGGVEVSKRLIDRLEIAIPAPSLGGVETLVSRPAVSSHAGVSPEDRREAGITDSLIRVSVGIESADDLIEDFLQAMG